MLNQSQVRHLYYNTVAELGAAVGRKGLISFCYETNRMYVFNNSSTEVVDGNDVIATGNGGNTRWIAYTSNNIRLTDTNARTIHVYTTGDDATGDGTIFAPYLTLNRALSEIYDNINTNITIQFGAGAFTISDTELSMINNFIFRNGATLNINGYTGAGLVGAGLITPIDEFNCTAADLGADYSGYFMRTVGGAYDYVYNIIAYNSGANLELVWYGAPGAINNTEVANLYTTLNYTGTLNYEFDIQFDQKDALTSYLEFYCLKINADVINLSDKSSISNIWFGNCIFGTNQYVINNLNNYSCIVNLKNNADDKVVLSGDTEGNWLITGDPTNSGTYNVSDVVHIVSHSSIQKSLYIKNGKYGIAIEDGYNLHTDSDAAVCNIKFKNLTTAIRVQNNSSINFNRASKTHLTNVTNFLSSNNSDTRGIKCCLKATDFVGTPTNWTNNLTYIYNEEYNQYIDLPFQPKIVNTSKNINMMGFTNLTSTSLSLVGDLLTLTDVSGGAGWQYYYQGTLCTISGNKTINITATTGIHFVFINSITGTLQQGTSQWDLLSVVPVAYILWDNDNTGVKGEYADERHLSTMLPTTHKHLHLTQGLQKLSGGGLTGPYTIGGTPVATSNNIGFAESSLLDEDLPVTAQEIVHTTGEYKVLFRRAAGSWGIIRGLSYPYYHGATTYIAYDSGTGLTELVNNRWVNTYVCYTNIENLKIIIIHGQTSYTSQAAAYAETFNSLNLTGLPVQEMYIAYQVTWRTSSAYITVNSCRIERILNLSQSYLLSVNIPQQSNHNLLNNLDIYPSHPSYTVSQSPVKYVTVVSDVNQSISSIAIGDIVNGVTLADGDTVCLANQTNPQENGIYVVSTTLSRRDDFKSLTDINRSEIIPQKGTIVSNYQVLSIVEPFTLDTTPIVINATTHEINEKLNGFTSLTSSSISINDTNITLSATVGEGVQYYLNGKLCKFNGSKTYAYPSATGIYLIAIVDSEGTLGVFGSADYTTQLIIAIIYRHNENPTLKYTYADKRFVVGISGVLRMYDEITYPLMVQADAWLTNYVEGGTPSGTSNDINIPITNMIALDKVISTNAIITPNNYTIIYKTSATTVGFAYNQAKPYLHAAGGYVYHVDGSYNLTEIGSDFYTNIFICYSDIIGAKAFIFQSTGRMMYKENAFAQTLDNAGLQYSLFNNPHIIVAYKITLRTSSTWAIDGKCRIERVQKLNIPLVQGSMTLPAVDHDSLLKNDVYPSHPSDTLEAMAYKIVDVVFTTAIVITDIIPGYVQDGYILVENDTFLLTAQNDATENGIYVCSLLPRRRRDFRLYEDIDGSIISVRNGNNKTIWKVDKIAKPFTAGTNVIPIYGLQGQYHHVATCYGPLTTTTIPCLRIENTKNYYIKGTIFSKMTDVTNYRNVWDFGVAANLAGLEGEFSDSLLNTHGGMSYTLEINSGYFNIILTHPDDFYSYWDIKFIVAQV